MKSKSEYTEEDEKALRELDAAMNAIKKSIGGKAGESAESKYAEVYNKCYRMGLKQYKLQVCKTTR